MADGIQRYWLGDDEYGEPALVPHAEGGFVRFSDVETRLEAADRLAEAVTQAHEYEVGHGCDCGTCAPIRAALAVYRSVGKEQDAA